MGFKDQLTQRGSRAGSRCTVGVWYDKQPPDIRADFDDVIEDNAFTSVAIARLISTEYGADLKGNTLARHRRGECRCA